MNCNLPDSSVTDQEAERPIRIFTQRLVLREFHISDLEPYQYFRAQPEFSDYYSSDEVSLEFSRKLLHQFLQSQRQSGRCEFQLAVEYESKLIGSCGIRRSTDSSGKASIGYEIDARFRRQGLAFEACEAMMHFAFSELKVRRLYADVVKENLPSIALLGKLGFASVPQPVGWDKVSLFLLTYYDYQRRLDYYERRRL